MERTKQQKKAQGFLNLLKKPTFLPGFCLVVKRIIFNFSEK